MRGKKSEKPVRKMPSDTVCRTIHQYNQFPIPEADMRKLQEIAADYAKVKNYVYARYGGIGSLPKLYPGYTIQNEMTDSGLRSELGLPSVYFYLAVFDALGEIKAQWTRTKTRIGTLVGQNPGFTEEDKHYLRFLLKSSNAFHAVVNGLPIELPKEIQAQHDRLAEAVNMTKLHRYLCRQVRKYHIKPCTKRADGFAISERAYRYQDHGIYLATKEKRKRVFVALTDNCQYHAQLYIKLNPEQGSLVIKVPVHVAVRKHDDYTNQVGLSFGMWVMLTTDQGQKYGERLGEYQQEYASWVQSQTGTYNRNREQNPGRKKYQAKKRRYEEQLHSYINHELNLFLQTEKPKIIYLPKLPGTQKKGVNKQINHSATLWQRGYIRRRLIQKCSEQSVEVAEVLGKGISRTCSQCGAVGNRQNGRFICPFCGYSTSDKTNAAQNAKKRGMEQRSYEQPFR